MKIRLTHRDDYDLLHKAECSVEEFLEIFFKKGFTNGEPSRDERGKKERLDVMGASLAFLMARLCEKGLVDIKDWQDQVAWRFTGYCEPEVTE